MEKNTSPNEVKATYCYFNHSQAVVNEYNPQIKGYKEAIVTIDASLSFEEILKQVKKHIQNKQKEYASFELTSKKSLLQINSALFLPKIIFAETHDDPITAQILKKLTPRLKELGYRYFYEEMDIETKIETLINGNKQRLSDYETLNQEFLSCGFNKTIEKASKTEIRIFCTMRMMGFKGYTTQYSKSLPPDEQDPGVPADILAKDNPSVTSEHFMRNLTIFSNEVWHIIKIHPSIKPYLEFYENLLENNISFQGTDCHNQSGVLFAIDKMEERDKFTAKRYLNSKDPFFARIGRAHAPGIQKEVSKIIPINIANISYSFYHIFRASDLFALEISGKVINPLIIDGRTMSDDEIIELIYKDILDKKLMLEEHHQTTIKEKLLCHACAFGKLDQVEELILREKVNIDCCDELGRNPLHYSVMRTELVEDLIKSQKQNLIADECTRNHSKVFEFLLENGGDITKENCNNNTPQKILIRDSFKEDLTGEQAKEMLLILKKYTSSHKITETIEISPKM